MFVHRYFQARFYPDRYFPGPGAALPNALLTTTAGQGDEATVRSRSDRVTIRAGAA